MDIIGIGTHIVECLRIAQLIERYGESFLRRVYTSREIEYCSSRRYATQQYASVWAAKEAVVQALGGTEYRVVDWRDIEIFQVPGKNPELRLAGDFQDVCVRREVGDVQVALSHCRTHATAYVIALGRLD